MTVFAAVPLLFFCVVPLLPVLDVPPVAPADGVAAPGVAGAGTTTSLPAVSAPDVEVW